MDAGATLVQSSPTTRSWLQGLRDRLPEYEYSEARYYAAFRTKTAGRAVAYLNPAKRTIRLFLPLEPRDDAHLQPTPSTSSWAARFPSVFQIAGAQDLLTATRLIVRSHAALGASPRKRPTRRPEHLAAEELPPEIEYVEGAARAVLVNAYERNRRARERCLRHYGRNCAICGLNFGARYGEPAAGYIQVHHIVPIAKVGVPPEFDQRSAAGLSQLPCGHPSARAALFNRRGQANAAERRRTGISNSGQRACAGAETGQRRYSQRGERRGRLNAGVRQHHGSGEPI